MEKKYKLTLENVTRAVVQCPYVACEGPYWDEYEIMPAKEFLDWVNNHFDNYKFKVYRNPGEMFFRVEVTPEEQRVEYGADFWLNIVETLAFAGIAIAIIFACLNVL